MHINIHVYILSIYISPRREGLPVLNQFTLSNTNIGKTPKYSSRSMNSKVSLATICQKTEQHEEHCALCVTVEIHRKFYENTKEGEINSNCRHLKGFMEDVASQTRPEI